MATQTRTRRRAVKPELVDSEAILADIAVITKVLQVIVDRQLLSEADCKRLQRLANEVTVGEMREWLTPRRLKVRPC